MIRIAIIAGVLHSGGKRNLIMEYYRHIDRTRVQFDYLRFKFKWHPQGRDRRVGRACIYCASI